MSPCTVLSATELPPWENYARASWLENLRNKGGLDGGGGLGRESEQSRRTLEAPAQGGQCREASCGSEEAGLPTRQVHLQVPRWAGPAAEHLEGRGRHVLLGQGRVLRRGSGMRL